MGFGAWHLRVKVSGLGFRSRGSGLGLLENWAAVGQNPLVSELWLGSIIMVYGERLIIP